jgi:hypothetical protein
MIPVCGVSRRGTLVDSPLNNRVGAQQQRWRNRDSGRLCGLEIDHQLELRCDDAPWWQFGE